MKVAGVLAVVGGLATFVVGSLAFPEGYSGARWYFFGAPVPDSLDPLIPLLYAVGVALCGVSCGLVLFAVRGRLAVSLASVSLILAGLALFIPRSIYRLPAFGRLAVAYSRHDALLLWSGLLGTTLPGLIGLVILTRRRLAERCQSAPG